jgi:uncharacterized protein YjiS (DUF1127 family)
MAQIAVPLSSSAGAVTGRRGVFARVLLQLELLLQVRKERRSLRELSEAGLKDIGLSRADVHLESGRSFWDLPGNRLL